MPKGYYIRKSDYKKNPILISITLLINGIPLIIIAAVLSEYGVYGTLLYVLGIVLTLLGVITLPFFIFDKIKKKKQEQQRIEYENRKEENRINELRKANITQLDTMSGKDFEKYLKILFTDLGYNTKQTKLSGDFGADLILEKEYCKILVQAKRYSHKVPLSAIQEIHTAKEYYNISSAIVVTTNYFTKSAIELAKKSNVKLINRDDLACLINKRTTGESDRDPMEDLYNPLLISGQSNLDLTEDYINQFSIPSQNTYMANLLKIQKKCDKLYFEEKYEQLYPEILKTDEIKMYEPKDIVSLHFHYNYLINLLYKTRKNYSPAIEQTLDICNKDIALFPKLKEFLTLSGTKLPSLQRKIIILEQQQKYEEAAEVCNYALSLNLVDSNGKNYNERKEKLLKKIS